MDDTDSLGGGCTTEVLFRLLQNLPEDVQVKQKRLVRLWPFARRRTRGNAAVAVELRVENEANLMEFLDEFWREEVLPLRGQLLTSNHSNRQQYPADPGMVWFSDVQVDEELYKTGLREEVTYDQLPISTRSWGGHGKIGATLAVLWPAKNVTYEAIAWRSSQHTGSRQLDKEALDIIEQMDDTFLCRDERLGTSMLAPRGVSPVLFGIRAWTKEAAKEALEVLVHAPLTETVVGSIVFATNQATNDHLDSSQIVMIESTEILQGGHTLLKSKNSRFIAFKESGEIATICQNLRQGDIVECKGLMALDGSIHIEFLKINHIVSKI